MKKLFFALALIASPIFANSDETATDTTKENIASCGCDIPEFTLDVLLEECPGKEKKESKSQALLVALYSNNRKALDFSFSALVGMVDALVMTHCLKIADMPGLSGMGKYAAMIPAGLAGWVLSFKIFEKTHDPLFIFRARHKIREEHACCYSHPSKKNMQGLAAGFAGVLLFMIGKSIKDTYFA